MIQEYISGMQAIRVSSLVKRYGEVEALRALELTVPSGTIFGVLGPNGAGKSTLIKTICGLTKPTSGEIQVLGLDADRERWTVRKRIGYMPQQPALYEDLSARQNLEFFGRSHNRVEDREQRISEVLEFLGLAERADSPVYGFSGGMKQRVSLGCALVSEPELLLLDEPTAGVDPDLRRQFWSYFRGLRDSRRTILLSTHQLDELMHCDLVTILQAGRAIVTGSPQEILALGEATVRVAMRNGQLIEYRMRDYERELPKLLRAQGVEQVERVEVMHATLEEILLKLMERDG